MTSVVDGRAASRMIKTLVGIGRPNTETTWSWTDALPPYRQQFFACYPNRKSKALLAAGNRVPALSASAVSDCEGGMKGAQLAEFY